MPTTEALPLQPPAPLHLFVAAASTLGVADVRVRLFRERPDLPDSDWFFPERRDLPESDFGTMIPNGPSDTSFGAMIPNVPKGTPNTHLSRHRTNNIFLHHEPGIL